jgi:dTDP-4-dehydrorhamnose 3,5-epimerase
MGDERGYFAETYVESVFREKSLVTNWAQDNQSFTVNKGTIRGLHFQAPPVEQTKLVRVPFGRILDVFVDIRKSSPTFGEWDSVEVSADLCNAVYVPRGFAHGFCTLEDNTLVQYKIDNVYSSESEGGIRWNDPGLAISWGENSPKLSEKDRLLPFFADFSSPFE